MFKEIRRKIALTNGIIFVALLVLLIVIFGILIDRGIGVSGDYYLHTIADEIIREERRTVAVPDTDDKDKKDDKKTDKDNKEKTEEIDEVDNTVHGQFGYEFIIWNTDQKPVRMRMDNKDLIVYGYDLYFQGIDKEISQHFAVGGDQYRVYSTPFTIGKTDYVLQVYQNINAEQTNVQYILFCLFLIGICGIIILIPLSYFLSGKTIRPIKENFESQKQFIADVSHELRTPLTVIQTNIEVLKMKEDEVLVDNIRWLNNIGNEAETMSALVSEMLMSAQADNKKFELQRSTFDLSALCAEIVDLMLDIAIEKQITLTSSIPTGIEYNGDEEKLKRAIRILVDNAIKYTPDGGEVILTLNENVRSISVSVSDTGVGLTKEEQKKVFTRFYRSDNARSTGGVGLGLNIAYIIVDQHNGKIKIDSKVDEGSTFTIVLPKRE